MGKPGPKGKPGPSKGRPPLVGEVVEVVAPSWAWQRGRVLKLEGKPPVQMEVEMEGAVTLTLTPHLLSLPDH